MTEAEKIKIEKINDIVEKKHQTTWHPLQWAQARLIKCLDKKWIKSEWMLIKLHDNINQISMCNGTLLGKSVLKSHFKIQSRINQPLFNQEAHLEVLFTPKSCHKIFQFQDGPGLAFHLSTLNLSQ